MGQRIAGVVYVKYTTATGDSLQLPLAGKWKVNFSRYKREGKSGQDGVHGYKEMPQVPSMEGDVFNVPELSIAALDNITDATVTLEHANGRIYVGRNGWRAEASELETEEGTTPVKFEFLEIIEA